MGGGTGGLTARGTGRAPGPPPPPPSRDDEANGGHRRGQRRGIWPRGRRLVASLVAMAAAAMFLLFADALAVAAPSAGWCLAAYVLWIIGLNMLVVWLMN